MSYAVSLLACLSEWCLNNRCSITRLTVRKILQGPIKHIYIQFHTNPFILTELIILSNLIKAWSKDQAVKSCHYTKWTIIKDFHIRIHILSKCTYTFFRTDHIVIKFKKIKSYILSSLTTWVKLESNRTMKLKL